MRICYVTMQFPAPSETFASNDVRELAARGCRLSVHALRGPHPLRPELVEQRKLRAVDASHNGVIASLRGSLSAITQPLLLIQVVRWLFSSVGTKAGHLARSLVLLPRAFGILEEIAESKPDVVHLYWGHYPSIVGFLVQRRLPGTVVSLSLSAYDLEMQYGGTRMVARQADVVRTLAHVNVADVAKLAGVASEEIAVVPDGIDIDRASQRSSGVEKVPYRIVTASRLVKEKGIDDVIEIFARIKMRWSAASLVIMGEGPDLERLRRLADFRGVSSDIRFLGHVDHSQVHSELGKAEVFLLMTRHRAERLPNVIKEGMACGAVCVTTPSPGIDELLVDSKTGFLVPPRDVEQAVEVVDRLFSREVETQQILSQARAHVAANFDLSRTASSYLNLWREAQVRRRYGSESSEEVTWRGRWGGVPQ